MVGQARVSEGTVIDTGLVLAKELVRGTLPLDALLTEAGQPYAGPVLRNFVEPALEMARERGWKP